MNLYLVQGFVKRKLYMNDKVDSEKDIRLVRAFSEEEAGHKWQVDWENKTSEYSVYYSAYIDNVSGILE